MAEFEIVDLSIAAPAPPPRSRSATTTGQGLVVGRVDTSEVAAALEALRKDISDRVAAPSKGLRLTQLVFRLTLSAEGKVAFVAKGAAEACIEVTFGSSS